MLKRMRNFLKNTSGSIVPTMAILIIPLSITAAAAIDYTRYVNMRAEVQTGLDAAGIASVAELNTIRQKVAEIGLTGSAFNLEVEKQLTNYADSFLEANITSELARNGYTLNTRYIPPKIDEESGIEITATITYDTIFGGLDGKDGGLLLFNDKIESQLTSLITTNNRTIEVALVLDNSSSMNAQSGGKTRLRQMQDASKQLMVDLRNATADSNLPKPVQFSIVPFNSHVSVGDLSHSNHRTKTGANAKFMDERGFSPIHNENFDWLNSYVTDKEVYQPDNNHAIRERNFLYLTRWSLFDMLNTEWAGCVEVRPWPHNVLDTYAESRGGYHGTNIRLKINGVSEGAKALFVPYFAPDSPDVNEAVQPLAGATNNNVKLTLNEDTLHQNVLHTKDFAAAASYRNNYLYDFRLPDDTQLYTESKYNDGTPLVSTNPLANHAFGEAGEDNQVNRTNWIFKYQSNVRFGNGTLSSSVGPNRTCDIEPITALTDTDDISVLNNAIDKMRSRSNTNLQLGLTWGWRSLSPGLPLDQGRAKDDVENLKFIIMLTDGENFLSPHFTDTPNRSQYRPWGYMRPKSHPLQHAITGEPTQSRILEGTEAADLVGTIFEGRFQPGSSDAVVTRDPSTSQHYGILMDIHTAQACENIKADGISIYTVVYDIDTPRVNDLMKACAGSGIINGEEVVKGVNFYHKAAGADLEDTFKAISSSISAIRIAQ